MGSLERATPLRKHHLERESRMGVRQSHECLRSSRRKVISTGTCLTLWRKPLTSNPRKGGCPVPTWAKRMVPCIIMMVDRWKVPDQITSEDPPKYRVQRKDQNERESRSDHGSGRFRFSLCETKAANP